MFSACQTVDVSVTSARGLPVGHGPAPALPKQSVKSAREAPAVQACGRLSLIHGEAPALVPRCLGHQRGRTQLPQAQLLLRRHLHL